MTEDGCHNLHVGPGACCVHMYVIKARVRGPGSRCSAGVITAMIGFFTSFGIGKKAFPAKLKEKQEQRLVVAERLLERELARERKAVA